MFYKKAYFYLSIIYKNFSLYSYFYKKFIKINFNFAIII